MTYACPWVPPIQQRSHPVQPFSVLSYPESIEHNFLQFQHVKMPLTSPSARGQNCSSVIIGLFALDQAEIGTDHRGCKGPETDWTEKRWSRIQLNGPKLCGLTSAPLPAIAGEMMWKHTFNRCTMHTANVAYSTTRQRVYGRVNGSVRLYIGTAVLWAKC